MLKLTTVKDISSLLLKEKKYVDPADAEVEAKHLVSSLDESLDAALHGYASEGKYTNVTCGNMSLIGIKSLRRCGYLEAAILLDGYMKDPVAGLALITRR